MNRANTILLLFAFLPMIKGSVLVYNDQKQNCTKYVNGNFCYDGSRFDSLGQYKSCSVPGTLALTFDDGPSPYTSIVLDALKVRNMKATFFLIGQYVYQYPDVVQRIVNEGHQIAAHTYTHPYLSDLTFDQITQEFMDFENAILQRNFSGPLAGRMVPNYFRAPHGAMTTDGLSVLNNFGMIPIHWSWLNGDSYTTDPSDILPNWVLHLGVSGQGTQAARLSSISQQHDREPATYNSIDDVLNYLQSYVGSQGTRFVTVAECLGNVLPPYQVSPRHQEDPTCSTGIQVTSQGVKACCASSCGQCGGTGCSTFPGGASSCCVTNIVNANVSCKLSKPPCIVT